VCLRTVIRAFRFVIAETRCNWYLLILIYLFYQKKIIEREMIPVGKKGFLGQTTELDFLSIYRLLSVVLSTSCSDHPSVWDMSSIHLYM
jgi:hypothetical protein